MRPKKSASRPAAGKKAFLDLYRRIQSAPATTQQLLLSALLNETFTTPSSWRSGGLKLSKSDVCALLMDVYKRTSDSLGPTSSSTFLNKLESIWHIPWGSADTKIELKLTGSGFSLTFDCNLKQ